MSKSKYGIERDYTITFKEIDTPTELERAQINQTKAQTDSVYVQSGILSPDEVRDNLIKDPNSGYNDITGGFEDSDLEGSESLGELVEDPSVSPSEAATLNGIQVTSMVNIASQVAKGELSRESAIAILEKSFNLSEQEASAIIGEQKLPDEQQEGNGETQQNPFKSIDQWEEGDPRRENGQFGEGNGRKSSKKQNKPSQRHNRVKGRQRKPLNLNNTEKAVLRDAVARNQFNDEEKESGYATRYTSQYKYTLRIENPELLSYTPIRRWKNK